MHTLLQRFLPVLLIVFICCSSAFAQIGGMVKNPANLTPIADVNINILNELTGTSTNEEAGFLLIGPHFRLKFNFLRLVSKPYPY